MLARRKSANETSAASEFPVSSGAARIRCLCELLAKEARAVAGQEKATNL